jgi:large subunit ribosomal protein L13
MKKAVYNSMTGNLQRRYNMQRLHLFNNAHVPQVMLDNVTNQIRQPRKVPTRLDHIDVKDVENFPKIMDFPKDYVLR